MTGAGARRDHRPLELVRGAWGLALLLSPRGVLRVVGDAAPDHRAVVTVRVLGARHLVQAVFSGVAPGPAVLADGAWVDGAHAATAVALAVADPARRRLALLDAAIAGTWGLLSVRALRRTAPVTGRAPWTERLAAAVHPLLPGVPALGRP